MPTLLLPALLILSLLATPAWAGATLDRIVASQRIVLAHRESSVPFSYVESGRPVGYAIELCLRLAEAVRRQARLERLEIAYTPVSAANRIDTIVQGRADLECGSTTNNAERRQQVAFTVPHYITGARLLVRADSPMDDVLLYGLRAARPDPTRLKVVGKYMNIEALAIMLARDDPAFKRIVDDEMKRLIRSGEAQALYARWFLRPIAPRNLALGLPMNALLKDFWKYPTDQVPF